MIQKKAVVFDLDDTLISERQYIQSGFKHISKLLSTRLDKSEFELYNLLTKLFEESSEMVFNRLLDTFQCNYSKDEILELVNEYRTHKPLINFFDDVLPCIKYLKSKGIKTGIITDGYKNSQRQKLTVLKANNYFDKIIVTDELGKHFWKPHPKSFEIMKDYLNIKYKELVYVGDNPNKDFYIGSIYPICTVRIKRDTGIYTHNNYYKGIKEDITISSLNEIIELLKI